MERDHQTLRVGKNVSNRRSRARQRTQPPQSREEMDSDSLPFVQCSSPEKGKVDLSPSDTIRRIGEIGRRKGYPCIVSEEDL